MVRILIIGLVAYALGHDHFDGARPTVLDEPLKSFYADVNTAFRNAGTVFGTMDDFRTMRYVARVWTPLDDR